jgi:Predicted transcriptional regulator
MIRIYLSKVLGEKRWSQAYLARRTGIRPNTISELYNELVDRVNLEHLDIICEVIGCDLTDILKYEPNDKSTE